MDELLKLIEDNLKDNPYYVIGKLSEVLGHQHNALVQQEQNALESLRFQQEVFKRMPDVFQQIINDLKAEDMANAQSTNNE